MKFGHGRVCSKVAKQLLHVIEENELPVPMMRHRSTVLLFVEVSTGSLLLNNTSYFPGASHLLL